MSRSNRLPGGDFMSLTLPSYLLLFLLVLLLSLLGFCDYKHIDDILHYQPCQKKGYARKIGTVSPST